MSALVMGSVAPDFPNLLFLRPDKSMSHSLPGMFLIDLPLAVVALWLFHTLLKKPMLTFLPDGFRRRLSTSVTSFSFWPWKRLWLILVSILVGIATHLGWDAFTHDTSWIYENWTFLRGSVELPVTGQMPIYKLLEFGSSVFGLAVLAVWIWNWYRTTEPSDSPAAPHVDGARRRIFVAGLTAFAVLGGALRVYHSQGVRWAIRPVVNFTADFLMATIALFLFGLLVSAVVERVRERRDVS